MYAPQFLFLVGVVDSRGVRAPSVDCLRQVEYSAEHRDFKLMAELARRGRDVAAGCRDGHGEGLFLLQMGLAHLALRDFRSAAKLIHRARGLFACTGDAGARINEAIALGSLALLCKLEAHRSSNSTSAARKHLAEALVRVDSASRAFSEAGDADAVARSRLLRHWVMDELVGLLSYPYCDASTQDDGAGGPEPTSCFARRHYRRRDVGYVPFV
jgi:hypothetical protein